MLQLCPFHQAVVEHITGDDLYTTVAGASLALADLGLPAHPEEYYFAAADPAAWCELGWTGVINPRLPPGEISLTILFHPLVKVMVAGDGIQAGAELKVAEPEAARPVDQPGGGGAAVAAPGFQTTAASVVDAGTAASPVTDNNLLTVTAPGVLGIASEGGRPHPAPLDEPQDETAMVQMRTPSLGYLRRKLVAAGLMCGNFDIVLDHLSRISQPSPTHAV